MVERWHPTSDSVLLIAPHPRGDYVRHSDYAALEAQLAEMVRVTVSETIRAMGENPDEQITGELTVFDAVAAKVHAALTTAQKTRAACAAY